MKKDISKTTLYTEVNRHIEDFIEEINNYKTNFPKSLNELNLDINANTKGVSEIIFFDLNNTKEYYVKGTEEQIWENGKAVGNKGSGILSFNNHVLNLERLNSEGRYLISFIRYLNGMNSKEYIESNIYNYSARIMSVEFEAKSIGGVYSLLIVARKANSYDWIHNANKLVTISSGSWANHKEYIYIPSNENFTILLDNRTVSNIPSSIQIKNLIIKEVF